MADDLKYGYKGAEPTQSFGNNTGVFDSNDINNLIADNKWTTFGQLELIETQTYSSPVSYIDFTTLGDYNVHFLTYQDVMPDTNNIQPMQLQFFESGVLETGSVYQYAQQYNYIGGSAELKSTADTIINLAYNINNTSPSSANGYCYMYNLTDSSKYSFITHHTIRSTQTTFAGAIFGSGVMTQASTVDGFRLKMSSNNYASFDISLYGIRYS